jgi:long-chain acyl-CoA synthetase
MIVDVETGDKEMPIGESGELVLCGPQVMKGYWNKPEETRNTLRSHDGKVWLHTGDIAVMDSDGYFRIVDRKKEMIITGGFNVYPREVEEVLFAYPSVMEAAVIGVKDEHSGERAKAFVVLKQGMSATEDEIIAYCRKNLAPYKVPKYVDFRESLPKSVVGKVLRRELAAEEMAKAMSKN